MTATGAAARAGRRTRRRGTAIRLGREAWSVLVETYGRWSADGAPRMAASLAYYTTLSLAPLLLVIIAVAGVVFGDEAARGELVGQIGALTGTESADAIEELLAHARRPAAGVVASAIGLVMLLAGATGVVGELENALNTIWRVTPSPRSWRTVVVKRLASLAMLLGVGFLLLVSLAISALLAAAGRYLGSLVPGNETAWMLAEMAASFAVITVLFASLFKFLPDVALRWSDVWVGAAATAVLFNLGKLLIGMYLGRSSIGSAWGAAGSLVVLLVWIYYAAQILLLGAEFTCTIARRRGGGCERRRAAPAGTG